MIPKFTIAWAIVYAALALGALVHPIYPMLGYLFEYYLHPPLHWWGRHLPDLRWSLTISLALLGSIVIKFSQLERVKDVRNVALPWLLFFAANTLLVNTWALNHARSWEWTVAMLKLILLYVLIPVAVRTRQHFDAFALMHIAGSFYWGWEAWVDPQREGGRLLEVGGPDTLSDNLAAAHLLTVLPFVAVFVFTAPKKWMRVAVAAAGAFIVNVFILCNSRGATVGLVISLGAALLLARRRRSRLVTVGFAALCAVLLLADPQYIARQQTTTNPTDGSALSRYVLWRAGLNIVRDYPLGLGGRAFHILSPQYAPEQAAAQKGGEKSAHNTYIQLATEWGVQGFILYMGFLFGTLRMLHRTRGLAPPGDWYYWRSLAIEAGLIGTMSAAMFSNRLYGESIYWMCALSYALYRIQATELAPAEDAAETRTPAAVPAQRAPSPAFRGAPAGGLR